MHRILIAALLLFLGFSTFLSAQGDKKALKNAERHIAYEEYIEAIPYLKEAIKINPENPQSQWMMGLAMFETHQKEKAAKHFKKAFQLKPDIASDVIQINHYYAKSLHYTLEFDEAILFYQKAKANYKPKDEAYDEIELAIAQCKYGKNKVKFPVNAKIINVGNQINSPFSEHSPVISADETVMFFTSRRPGNMGSSKDGIWHDEDIYMTTKVGDSWSKPVNMDKPINKKDHDATIALSADGQEMFIYKNPPGSGDIFACKLEGTEWTEPKNLGAPISSKYYETSCSISSDGKTLYFASDRPGGLGKLDIWKSELNEKGEWGEAINLGAPINTPYNDDSPFIHPNGVELYYSSDGVNSIGGDDIFKTVLLPGGFWSTPENIGYPINTPDHDIYFVLSADGRHGYYASAKEGGYGEKDIYMIIMPEPEVVAEDTTSKDTVVKPVVVRNPLTILKGKVTDFKSHEPIGANIKIIDINKNQVISTFKANTATGKYLVSLPSGRNYGIEVEAKDYLFHSEHFDIPAATDYQEIEKDVELKKIEIGSSIVLRNIFFDHDKATLRPESVAELEELHSLLDGNPKLRIEISGHTDNVGSDEYNQKLSQRRARAVVDYLIEKGVAASRLEAKGYGEAAPIDSNETAEGRQNNRRTEFKVLAN